MSSVLGRLTREVQSHLRYTSKTLRHHLRWNSSQTTPFKPIAAAQHPFLVKPVTPHESYVSCTIFNERGDVTAVSHKFPKWEFLQKYGLYPRDLRKIDSSSIDVIPSFVIKPKCILVNLLHIKAMIQKDKVFVFDTANPDAATKLGVLMYDLESKLSQRNATHQGKSISYQENYEHRALESILINVMTCLETEYKYHHSVCGMILNDLENQIDRDKLRDLLIKSKNLTAFAQKSVLLRDLLDELLESDEDLAGMYLSEKKLPDADDHSDLEMLLETYYKQCDEYVQQSEALIQDIKSTEEIVNIILDANRNSLLLFELKVTVYTLGFTVATLVPAFYGMNLKNFIEESNWGFASVVGVSTLAALLVTISNMRALRSVTRLTLLNNHTGAHNTKHLANAKMALDKEIPTFWSRWKTSAKVLWSGREVLYKDGSKRDMIWKWLVDDDKK
ncbi:magnesium ion transporter [Kluyveromyces marxianus]|nr:magnesium ion transporter [Kluyveromyces marxianus]KAG0685253.1 magnesium ion transporter [Kluyveromyces marxianus]